MKRNIFKDEAFDDLHYSTRNVDSYNRTSNFIISGRGSGKSTTLGLKAYEYFANTGAPYFYFRRRKINISEPYILSLQDSLNKFLRNPIVFKYNKASINRGMVDIYVNDFRFLRLIALSNDLQSLKSYFLKDTGGIIYDEFICDLLKGEKYLKEEPFIVKEIYTTYARECSRKLKIYYAGNPYSLFNPFFMDRKIEPEKLKLGEIYAPKGVDYVVDYYKAKPELIEKMKKENPFFNEFDYAEYALQGINVSDRSILIEKQHPKGFKLLNVYFLNGKNLGVFTGENKTIDYWISFIDVSKINREVYCFDISDLSSNRKVLTLRDLRNSHALANATRSRRVGFSDINVYYYFLEIYKYL